MSSIYRCYILVVKATWLKETDKGEVTVLVVRWDFSLVTCDFTLTDTTSIIHLKHAKLFLEGTLSANLSKGWGWNRNNSQKSLKYLATQLFVVTLRTDFREVEVKEKFSLSGTSSLLNCYCFRLKNPQTAGWWPISLTTGPGDTLYIDCLGGPAIWHHPLAKESKDI